MSEADEIGNIARDMNQRMGASSGLNGTLKFDFEGKGVIFIDGKSNPNSVTTSNDPADCTITMSLDTFRKIVARELDPTNAFMQGKLRVAGEMGLAMKLGPILDKAAG